MSIAELAKRSGIEIALILSYEKADLLPKPRRTPGRHGKLAYHREHLDGLMFIRRALETGFSLDAIAELTDASGGLRTCNDIARIAERQLADVRRELTNLQRMEADLCELIDKCERKGPGSTCSILNTLRQPAPSGADCCRPQG
jgi:DNA-binding transcriptional MerR regulator